MKINIHLQLPPDTAARVREANAGLDELEPSRILFPPCIPHVTLLMGTIDADQLDATLDAVESWAHQQPSLVLHLNHPSLPNGDGWVFLDAKCVNGDLKEIRRDLAGAMGRLVEPSTHGGPDTHNHLTLGRCEGAPPPEHRQLFVPEDAVISDLAVGCVGENGTVVDTLASFRLRDG